MVNEPSVFELYVVEILMDLFNQDYCKYECHLVNSHRFALYELLSSSPRTLMFNLDEFEIYPA